VESCPVCGFAWDAVAAADIVPRLRAAGEGIVAELGRAEGRVRERPSPDRWSMLEYGAHVRDVLLNLRDRIILGAIEEHPTPKSMHPDARVALGLYAAETPAVTAAELQVAVALFGRAFGVLDGRQLERTIFYGWPRAASRSLRWVAAQALHEAEHHLADMIAAYDQVTA
jgi:hypothetical protein